MPPSTPTTYIFAGGGTGGHLYPGLAVAAALRELDPSSAALFLCSDRAIDSRILTQEGVEFRTTHARPFSVRPRGLARFLGSWGKTVRLGREVIHETGGRKSVGRGVHLVAMGGFVAAPLVQAARVERIPITMVNLDAIPGKANRWIARRIASASPPGAGILTTLPIPAGHSYAASWSVVPPIVRPAAVATAAPAECRRRLGLHPDRPTLMVTGGSLGASSINRLMRDLASSSPRALAGWQVLHQTGAKDDADLTSSLQAGYAAAGAASVVTPFVGTIGDWWGAADLAVSRAGAGSVAEAWANNVPTLFLPYPYHKDLHQRFNAEPLERAGGAVVAADRIDPRANLSEVSPVLVSLLQDQARRTSMRTALARLGPADGARRIALALIDASPAQRGAASMGPAGGAAAVHLSRNSPSIRD